jgi:hypothetical protein
MDDFSFLRLFYPIMADIFMQVVHFRKIWHQQGNLAELAFKPFFRDSIEQNGNGRV